MIRLVFRSLLEYIQLTKLDICPIFTLCNIVLGYQLNPLLFDKLIINPCVFRHLKILFLDFILRFRLFFTFKLINIIEPLLYTPFSTAPHSKRIIHALFYSSNLLFTFLQIMIVPLDKAFLLYNFYGITDKNLANYHGAKMACHKPIKKYAQSHLTLLYAL